MELIAATICALHHGTIGAIGGGILAGTTHFISYTPPAAQNGHQYVPVNMAALTSKVVGYGLSILATTITGASRSFSRSAKIHPTLAHTLPELLSENLCLAILGIGLGFIVLGSRLPSPTNLPLHEIAEQRGRKKEPNG